MSGAGAVFGRGGYPIAELSGMASAGLDARLDAIVAEQSAADAGEVDGMCS